jgi:ubiquinone/menaquinone biosynthesis C-methylase UbiE
VDINAYLLQEAKNLARKEGLDHAIEFREGNAEALPFADNSFDVVMSITVMEEVNADRMLAEMFRVARPSGRVGVLVRSVDLPQVLNLPLPPELKQKLEAPGAGGTGAVGDQGCADASLYRRFHQAGLAKVKMLPQLGVFSDRAELEYQQSNILATLSDQEAEQWRTAAAQAEAEGTLFLARTFHCAVGTKPG